MRLSSAPKLKGTVKTQLWVIKAQIPLARKRPSPRRSMRWSGYHYGTSHPGRPGSRAHERYQDHQEALGHAKAAVLPAPTLWEAQSPPRPSPDIATNVHVRRRLCHHDQRARKAAWTAHAARRGVTGLAHCQLSPRILVREYCVDSPEHTSPRARILTRCIRRYR